MRINEDQKGVLDSLTIERISANPDSNIRLINSFENYRVNEKKCALRNKASQDDEAGITAYYLIKDACGKLMFYFSLKCGMLYDGSLYTKVHEEQARGFKDYYTDRGLGVEMCSLQLDMEIDGNGLILRGEHTYPAIELAHFFRNDNYDFKGWRERYQMPQIGTIIFWKFVIPCVLKARESVGCQYLYLFAADDSDDRKLVNYYADKLKFRTNSEVGTVKPVYDFTCEFMCQEIEPLKGKMDKFFNEEFNLTTDDV